MFHFFSKKNLKRIGIITFLFFFISYQYVEWVAAGNTYDKIEKMPKNHAGLVFGTSQYAVTGGLNAYFYYRIEAAALLYKQGKISKIIVSGDNRTLQYNEPKAMKEALLERGIPKEAIVEDFAGLRTLDSVIRAKAIFGQTSITLISQEFQNKRAIAIAEHYGIVALGFNAAEPQIPWIRAKVFLREILARTAMMVDLIAETDPRHLGEKIDINN
ncbi:MAG: SanA protein [Parcubacteria group bacterium Gr01-1014_18]|nr:MAG: SanA protein [Parcubacteria group bacterium Greene0416_36]TSC81529.1 MAG: SanA protein [Parcubacteria group bacterium Gr01-1014_18]TSC99660.1 MAG: SanA protein [Parcubacteria group bacterium Greene1014_20]TSD07111.1 MAG: SanA protein [Parcubacteria group bacterium Greene0714_2]